jgi:tRNA threonylcarbamoyladenosine biosynthesis protein TsaB
LTVLAIDTSTESLGLALEAANASMSLSLRIGYRHAETLVPWIDNLLRQAEVTAGELDLVAVSIGPGSFTGLRIGLSTAKGIAAGSGCAVVGVPTLDAWAWGFRRFPGVVIPMIDARRKRIYTSFYRAGERFRDVMDIPRKALMRELRALKGTVLLTGPAAADMIAEPGMQDMPFSAALDPLSDSLNPMALLQKGITLFEEEGSHGDSLTPLYLRKSEAESKRDNCQPGIGSV